MFTPRKQELDLKRSFIKSLKVKYLFFFLNLKWTDLILIYLKNKKGFIHLLSAHEELAEVILGLY